MKQLHKAVHRVKANGPFLLSGTSIIGVATTAYLAAQAGHKHARRMSEEMPDTPFKETFLKVWKFYIPPTASGVVTVGCIIGNTRVSRRRTAAAQAAFVLSERAYSEYRDHVVAEVGSKAEQKIRDKVAEKQVHDNPASEQILAIAGPGNVLCFERFTGRYFTSDMETLRQSANKLNERLLHFDLQDLSDWYDYIGLQHTAVSDNFGWTSDKLMELEFSTILTDRGLPCLAFDYNYIKPIR